MWFLNCTFFTFWGKKGAGDVDRIQLEFDDRDGVLSC